MNPSAKQTVKLGALITITSLAIAIIAAACGSGSDGTDSDSTAPTAQSAAQPTATFQSIQVTSIADAPPTEVPTPAGTPSTRGASKDFPEILDTSENLTVGPRMTSWQNYLNDSVMIFESNTWDLCKRGNGVALGKLMNGGIVWTLGLPREGMLGNEVFFTVWNPQEDVGAAYVLGHQNDTPVLKVVTNYEYTDTVTPYTYKGEPIPFEMYELTNCLNL
jgi:hypothetical protein